MRNASSKVSAGAAGIRQIFNHQPRHINQVPVKENRISRGGGYPSLTRNIYGRFKKKTGELVDMSGPSAFISLAARYGRQS